MKVYEFARQIDVESADILTAVAAINSELKLAATDGETQQRIEATSPQSRLEDADLELLNSHFELDVAGEVDDGTPPKLIPLYLFEVRAIRLKGKGPGIINEKVRANDESEANRQVIVKRNVRGHAYKFNTRRVEDLGPHVRPSRKSDLIPATPEQIEAASPTAAT